MQDLPHRLVFPFQFGRWVCSAADPLDSDFNSVGIPAPGRAAARRPGGRCKLEFGGEVSDRYQQKTCPK
jgi:hypothetical protein